MLKALVECVLEVAAKLQKRPATDVWTDDHSCAETGDDRRAERGQSQRHDPARVRHVQQQSASVPLVDPGRPAGAGERFAHHHLGRWRLGLQVEPDDRRPFVRAQSRRLVLRRHRRRPNHHHVENDHRSL